MIGIARKGAILFCAAVLAAAPLAAQEAEGIVRASRERIQADSVYTRSTMILKANNGAETRRVIEQFSKDGPKGNRGVVVFHEPKSVAGTRFLTMENPGGEDDRWIFLPNRGRVQRIAAADGSKSFVGTDFSNDDISSADRDVDLDRHSLLREEDLEGNPCYVIQSIPKDSSYQYGRMIQWIDKNNRVCRRIDLYDRKNVLVKTLEILKLEEKDGRLSPIQTRMTSRAAGTYTQINVDDIRYNARIPEGIFTQEYLATGRPR
ncbi:MAG: outer membrane lipoprotein-sorting protein [Treponema sp.]|jgi:outer membrane lipoprotein-sorting protein|nr:outer membrane lipoprotein-sorting protein [Treponema sp.]